VSIAGEAFDLPTTEHGDILGRALLAVYGLALRDLQGAADEAFPWVN